MLHNFVARFFAELRVRSLCLSLLGGNMESVAPNPENYLMTSTVGGGDAVHNEARSVVRAMFADGPARQRRF